MKTINFYFNFTSISFLAKAENVTDFQIEGMSVGDSLLEYYIEKQILEN